MKTIAKIVVGSRLHGLADKNSDYDYRGIFMHSLKNLISPFKKLKNTVWIEGDTDNTAYELSEFCKFAAQGNPSILEVLWGNQIITDSKIFKELRENRLKFLDSKRIYESHRGYSHNQSKKMNLFDPDERSGKYCVAYMRSLIQGIDLLKTGNFSPQIVRDRDFFLEVRNNFINIDLGKLTTRFRDLLAELDQAYENNKDKFKPDINWIEDFILKSYLNEKSNNL